MGDARGVVHVAMLLAGVAIAACVAACAPEMAPAAVVAPAPTYVRKLHAPGPMDGVRATRMTDALAAAGLDVRNLPPIEQLTAAQKQKVMRTFTETLGVPCVGCHAEDDFASDTRRKRVAKRMYNEIVRVLTLRDGEPVYCDSCHDGTMHMLDRRETVKVSTHMSENLVGQMARVDGRPHDCTTCHGDPPDFKMLTTWKLTTAPDVLLAPATTTVPGSAPAASNIVDGNLPANGPRSPTDCGPHSELCPLQHWMIGVISNASAADDAKRLAWALDNVAGFSPDASWSWASISREAASAARRGDLVEARRSCVTCHVLYKAKWREKYRARKLP
jgi:hypothetical protein